MSRVYLQDMVEDIQFDSLPPTWQDFDLKNFSRTKTLWPHQRRALENAIKALWKYYDDLKASKQKFFQWYQNNGLDEKLDFTLPEDHRLAGLLQGYYPVINKEISFEHFINRACFWMATGSGKTLVIVKLIEILGELIRRGEIPPNDILVLTHRDDLIEQLKRHVEEFNAVRGNLSIQLKELREYPEAKRYNLSLFKEKEITVFYYRSDNLSDKQKERIVDFRNYDNDGRWYVLLDEAHKGDKEDSKRQHIYAILSRNGFLFNFSATFTDPRDLATTVFNFNLSEFIRAGYGKHITVLKQELRAFRDGEDYSGEEKQKIVLKSLLMLAYAHKHYEEVRQVDPDLYHRPLMLTLVHSVNTKDADLELFFRELERIGKGDIRDKVWKAAKEELREELRGEPPFMFEENEGLKVDEGVFKGLEPKDILRYVYNAQSPGEIEVLVRSNRQELAFKLKTSDKPFALIKIGDISGWLKEKLAGYEVVEGFEDEGFFERLNADDSDINILMGSRTFYEGWDSNRPNVINFINIGVGEKARKFILQAVGRGVRIEPVKNKRKRLRELYNAKEVPEELFEQVKDKVRALETLVIFGTNRKALQTVIEELNKESQKRRFHRLSLFKNTDADRNKLLIPVYRQADKPIVGRAIEDDERVPFARFEIDPDERELLDKYVNYVGDKRVLMALYDTEPLKIALLKQSLADPDRFYKEDGARPYRNLDLLVRRILDYFSILPEEFEQLKPLKDEISHFRNVQVALKDISDLVNKVKLVSSFEDPEVIKERAKDRFNRGEITLEEYTEEIERAARMVKEEQVEYEGKRLKIRYVANHYYIPVILSGEKERINYIKHIIQTPSEVDFLNKLEKYLERSDNKFKEFDWWMFSKIDESVDEVYIPWYDGKTNKVRKWKPDFIFWLQKGDDYFIVFVDPKGTEHTEYQRKIDGYSALFEESGGVTKVFGHEGNKVRVFAFLYTADRDGLPERYRDYWFDKIEGVLTRILAESSGEANRKASQ